MKLHILPVLVLLFCGRASWGQGLHRYADSIRKVYQIPELGYAVISSDHVYESDVTGYKKKGTDRIAENKDLFRIGSNTKAITGFIAAMLVKQGKISWNTRFFDLFPEMKEDSRPIYYDLTLLDLLSLRTKLFPYTYTNGVPLKIQFKGNESEQRYQFTEWFLKHAPTSCRDSICFSNLGYIAAGLMMEKVSGKPYKQMVQDLGDHLGIHFYFGRPVNIDTLQPWGHDQRLVPEPPGDDYKLNWLLQAGNITVNLPDYVKFIQLQLQGLAGRSDMLSKDEFHFLHYGLARFAVGWFWDVDERGYTYSYNNGNPGTFLSGVYVYQKPDRAFILLSNAQTEEAEEGLSVLYTEMKRRYLKE